jgi:hypothetical protein
MHCCIIVGAVFAMSGPPRYHDPILITLKVDKADVRLGEKSRLEETSSSFLDLAVASIHHSVLTIGEYDAKLVSLVNLDKRQFLRQDPSAIFKGLPLGIGSSHGISLKTNKKIKSITFSLEAQRLGVFMITAKWSLRETGQRLSSNPIIIMVRPSMPGKGSGDKSADNHCPSLIHTRSRQPR